MSVLKRNWWKFLGAILVFYGIIWGFLGEVPRVDLLNETIRALYFHVTMWFAMIILMLVSVIFSIIHLRDENPVSDLKARETALTGIVMALIGLATGSIWARFTWGAFWVASDAKLNGTAVAILIYLAYFVLRGSIEDPAKRGRIAAVYNIFAFIMMIVFIQVLPRINDSLHPGQGGNSPFTTYDMDNNLRMVFYPAVIGWTLIGVWISTLKIRYKKLFWKIEEKDAY